MAINGGDLMKTQKCYRVLCLYDHLKNGETVSTSEAVKLFEVDHRTIQRDINDIRCYLENKMALQGNCSETIIYRRNKGGYVIEKIA